MMDFKPIISGIEKEIQIIKQRHLDELAPYELILTEAKNLSIRATCVNSNNDNLMGVRWYKNAQDTKLERLGTSRDKRFIPENSCRKGFSDFDNMPIYKDIKPCVMKDGKIVGSLSDLCNSNRYDGDIMVEIPKFYYRFDNTEEYIDLYISDTNFAGSHVSPHHDRKHELDKAYIAAYVSNSKYSSQSGYDPLTNKSLGDFRKGHSNKGNGYSTWDYAAKKTIEMLYLVEVADFDSQSAVGCGNINSGNVFKTGLNDNMLFHSGCINSDSGVRYRWIENLWGNVYQFVDGILFNNDEIYICKDPDKFSDCITPDYIKLSYRKASDDGVIKNFGFDENHPWAMCPAEVCDDDDEGRKHICDYYWYNNGLRILIVGGNCNNGSFAGLFFFSCNYSPSVTLWTVSSRLSCTG